MPGQLNVTVQDEKSQAQLPIHMYDNTFMREKRQIFNTQKEERENSMIQMWKSRFSTNSSKNVLLFNRITEMWCM